MPNFQCHLRSSVWAAEMFSFLAAPTQAPQKLEKCSESRTLFWGDRHRFPRSLSWKKSRAFKRVWHKPERILEGRAFFAFPETKESKTTERLCSSLTIRISMVEVFNWPQLQHAPNKIWSVNRDICQRQYYDNNDCFFFEPIKCLVINNMLPSNLLPVFCFSFLHGHVTAILTSREWYASNTWTGVLFQLAVKSRPRPHFDVWRVSSLSFLSSCQHVKIFRHWVF